MLASECLYYGQCTFVMELQGWVLLCASHKFIQEATKGNGKQEVRKSSASSGEISRLLPDSSDTMQDSVHKAILWQSSFVWRSMFFGKCTSCMTHGGRSQSHGHYLGAGKVNRGKLRP